MDEIIRIKAGTLSDIEEQIYNNSNGAVIKTIMLYNNNDSEKEVTLNIDSVTFSILLQPKETRILSNSIKVNLLKAKGQGFNIHITGIQLGGA